MKSIPIAVAAALAFFGLASCNANRQPESVALVGASVIDDHDAVTHDLARALSRATAIHDDAPVEDLVGRETLEHDAFVISEDLRNAAALLQKNKDVPLPGDAAEVNQLKGRTEQELNGAVESADNLDEKLQEGDVPSMELAEAADNLERSVRRTAEEHAALMNDIAQHQEIHAVLWEQLWPQHELAVRHSREMATLTRMLGSDRKDPHWKTAWERNAEALQTRLESADRALKDVEFNAPPESQGRIDEIRRLHADMQKSLADLRKELSRSRPDYAAARRNVEAMQESLKEARAEHRTMMQERGLGAYPDYDQD